MSGIIGDNTGRGTGLIKAVGGGAWNLIATQTASTDASIEFDGNMNDTYRVYKLIIDHWVGSVDGPYLNSTFKRDGEGSYNTGASDYKWVADRIRTGGNLGTRAEDTSDAVMRGRNNLGSSTGASTNIEMTIFPRTGEYPVIWTQEVGFDSTPALGYFFSIGALIVEADVQSIKLAPADGSNIVTGNFVLYGLSIS
jgi:hypothetical protein